MRAAPQRIHSNAAKANPCRHRGWLGQTQSRGCHPVARELRLRLRASTHHHDQQPDGRAAHPQGLFTQGLQPAAIGSLHGEGFVHFSTAGVSRVDVDTLNDSLRSHGAMRLRHAMRPDEAFGMIFSFDGVVADLNSVRAEAWRALAAQHGLPVSDALLASPALHSLPSDVAVVRVLRWAGDRRTAAALAAEHAQLAGAALASLTSARPGLREWLDALGRFRVPCAIVSSLDRSTLRRCLERLTLHDHFDALVTAEDEAETLSQRLLVAAMKLGRPPNMCVAYDASPEGVTAAHNVSMKAVAVQGRYMPHELRCADVTCSSLSELTVYNVRRLFANMGSEFMDLQQQQDRQSEDGVGHSRRRRNRNATL